MITFSWTQWRVILFYQYAHLACTYFFMFCYILSCWAWLPLLLQRHSRKKYDNIKWIYSHKSSWYSALVKSTGLRTDGLIDNRSFWINYVSPLSVPLAISWVHPRLIAIHKYNIEVWIILVFMDRMYFLCFFAFPQVFTVNSFLIHSRFIFHFHF